MAEPILVALLTSAITGLWNGVLQEGGKQILERVQGKKPAQALPEAQIREAVEASLAQFSIDGEAQKVLKALGSATDDHGRNVLGQLVARAAIHKESRHEQKLIRNVQEKLNFQTLGQANNVERSQVERVIGALVGKLRHELFSIQGFGELLNLNEIRQLLETYFGKKGIHDDSDYLRQVQQRYGYVGFAGIPFRSAQPEIPIHTLAIDLRAKRNLGRKALLYHSDAEFARRVDEAGKSGESPEQLARSFEVDSTRVETVELRDFLPKHKLIVVLGDPGAGKSLLLRRRVIEEADSQNLFPVFVQLSHYARQGSGKIREFIEEFASNSFQLELSADFFEQKLTSGSCLICFDGLDEVSQTPDRIKVRDQVQRFIQLYPQHTYLISSRIVGYGAAPITLGQAEEVTLEPFTPEQIQSFVGKWYTQALPSDTPKREQRTADLLAELDPSRNPRIADLAKNPLLLTIIALVHRDGHKLPQQRAQLYQRSVGTMTDTWDSVQERIPSDAERPYYKRRRRILERIAFNLQNSVTPGNANPALETDELKRLVREVIYDLEDQRLIKEDCKEEAERFVDYTEKRTGLLYEQGQGSYSFVHQTFREYLAATDILNRRDDDGVPGIWEEIQPKLHHPNWREVILLLCGEKSQSDKFVSKLVEKILTQAPDIYEPILQRNLFLAAQILADVTESAHQIRQEVVDRLGQLATSRPTLTLLRIDAIRSLGLFEDNPQAAQVLLTLVQNPKENSDVRRFAAQALGQLGRVEEAAQTLLALVQNPKEDSDLRRFAAQTLGQLGRVEEAAQSLLALAQTPEEDSLMRGYAAQALGKLGRVEEAAQTLLALSQNPEEDSGVRDFAAQALGKLGRVEEAAPTLLALSQNPEEDSHVRGYAAQALGKLGRVEGVAQALLALAQNPKEDSLVRYFAALALENLSEPQSLLKLWELDEFRREAYSGLKKALVKQT
ncbi:MAG: HEAT repeat domain-containing protein [Meiothermus sp.]|nr:HEAT repeat domain-containing protein [Meiothermus sp.]